MFGKENIAVKVTDIIICQPVWGDHVLIKPNIVFLLVRVYGIFKVKRR